MTVFKGLVIGLALLVAGAGAWAQTAKEWTAKGDEAFKTKAYEKAVEYYSNALAENPEFGPARYNRARTYVRLKKIGPALADLDKAKTIKGVSDRAWNLIGMIHASAGEFRNALVHFKKANKIRPSATYLVNACLAAKKLGKDEEALKYCKQAYKLEPKNPRARAHLRSLKESLATSGCPPTFRQIYLLRFGASPADVGRVFKDCPPTASKSSGSSIGAAVEWTWTSENRRVALHFTKNRLREKHYDARLDLSGHKTAGRPSPGKGPKTAGRSSPGKGPKCPITFAEYKRWVPNVTRLKSIENFIFENPPEKATFVESRDNTVTLAWQWAGGESLDLRFKGGKLISKDQTNLP